MKRLMYLLPTMIAAAFLLPNLAAAKPVDVKGPLMIGGVGFVRGELTMANAAESRGFTFGTKAGYIGFLDLKGDLKVRCQGFDETSIEETDEGKVYFCMGERGRALARGSHFVFRAFGLLYRARIAEGTSGTLTGRFVDCTKPADGAAADEDHPRLCGNPGQAGQPGQPADRAPGAAGDRGPGANNGSNNGPGSNNGRGNGPGGNGSGGNGSGSGSGSGNADNLPSLAELAALLTAKK